MLLLQTIFSSGNSLLRRAAIICLYFPLKAVLLLPGFNSSKYQCRAVLHSIVWWVKPTFIPKAAHLRPLGVNGVEKPFIITNFPRFSLHQPLSCSYNFYYSFIILTTYTPLFWCAVSLSWQLQWHFPVLEGIPMNLKALGNILAAPS